jgi:hypothetical protein
MDLGIAQRPGQVLVDFQHHHVRRIDHLALEDQRGREGQDAAVIGGVAVPQKK